MRLKPNPMAAVRLIAFGCVITVLAALFALTNGFNFSSKTAEAATTVSGFVGPLLSFLTLAFVLLNYHTDNQEKSFRQTLELLEKLLGVYTKEVATYNKTSRAALLSPLPTHSVSMIPYAQRTQPLFAVVMLAMQGNSFADPQYQGLRGIILSQLRPLVEQLAKLAQQEGTPIELVGHQIPKQQLAEIDSLPAT